MRFVQRLCAVVFAALVLAGAAAMPVQAAPSAQAPTTGNTGLGIRLLEAPVALAKDPRAQNYIVDNLPPGTTINRKFEVVNNTGAQRVVALYPAAASIAEKGGFILEEGHAKNELTSWMRVTPSSVTVPNGGSVEASVRIAVPRTATEDERYAVIWAETGNPAKSGGITTVSRVGIRTYLSVGPGNGPPADFAIGSVTPGRSATGAPQLTVQINNTGKRALDPDGTVTLSDGPGGISAAAVKSSGGSVTPGGSGTMTFAFDAALPKGPWKAAIAVSSGVVSKDGSASVTFPDSTIGNPVDVSSPSSGLQWWAYALIALAIVVVVGSVVLLAVRRRRHVEP